VVEATGRVGAGRSSGATGDFGPGGKKDPGQASSPGSAPASAAESTTQRGGGLIGAALPRRYWLRVNATCPADDGRERGSAGTGAAQRYEWPCGIACGR